eukprot:Hpha_TRINITY_DN17696_c0_g1::TRINITY_DN17696_c0_g1_i1::g.158761::m.158761
MSNMGGGWMSFANLSHSPGRASPSPTPRDMTTTQPPRTGLGVPVWRRALSDSAFRDALRRRLVARAFPVHRSKDPKASILKQDASQLRFSAYLSKARWQRVEDRAREAQRAARDLAPAEGRSRWRAAADEMRTHAEVATGGCSAVQTWLLRWWELVRKQWSRSPFSNESEAVEVDRDLYIRVHVAFHFPLLYARTPGCWTLPVDEHCGVERLAEADWRRESANARDDFGRARMCAELWRWAAAWAEGNTESEVSEMLSLSYDQLASAASSQNADPLPTPSVISGAPRATVDGGAEEVGDLDHLTPHERGLLGLLEEDEDGYA